MHLSILGIPRRVPDPLGIGCPSPVTDGAVIFRNPLWVYLADRHLETTQKQHRIATEFKSSKNQPRIDTGSTQDRLGDFWGSALVRYVPSVHVAFVSTCVGCDVSANDPPGDLG